MLNISWQTQDLINIALNLGWKKEYTADGNIRLFNSKGEIIIYIDDNGNDYDLTINVF